MFQKKETGKAGLLAQIHHWLNLENSPKKVHVRALIG